MKTKLFYYCIILLFSINTLAIAQEAPFFGLKINVDAAKNKPIYTGTNSGEKSGTVRESLDLSPLAPDVFNQGATNTCVTWATVAAYTIQKALTYSTRPSRKEINDLAMSGIFPYAIITKEKSIGNCENNIDIDTIAGYVKNRGNVYLNELHSISCQISISMDLKKKAPQNKFIEGYEHLFDGKKANDEQKYKAVLNYLEKEKKPVIAGMLLLKGHPFWNLSNRDSVYRPDYSKINMNLSRSNLMDDFSGHAMTVVGFSRVKYGGAFKIMNSYGSKWGSKGYFWMPFKLFGQSISSAIRLILPNEETSFAPKKVEVSGEFIFNYTGKDGTKNDMIPYHTGQGVYELKKKDWKVEQTFQLVVNSIKSKQSLCVFSIDALNKVELHWPQPIYGMGVDDQLKQPNSKMILPDENNLFNIENPGSDYLIVLYSDSNIASDWRMIKDKIASTSGDVMARLRGALGERLMETNNISYENKGMKFNALGKETTGDIVPIVLKVESIR